MKRIIPLCLSVILGAAGSFEALGQAPVEERPAVQVKTVTTLLENGGRVSWSVKQNRIACDRAGADGRYDVFTMNLDGAGLRCLTCSSKGRPPQLNNGQPAFHPSGRYIVFQAQDPDLMAFPGRSKKAGHYLTSPGIGINNNLWLMTTEGSRFWQLTRIRERHGVLHPHFSPDGSRLVWSEIISKDLDGLGGVWAIKLADFRMVKGKPRLKNTETLRPGSLQLYETHGFSPDGRKIIFSGVAPGKAYYDMEIYLLDLSTHRLTRLTHNHEWDEHAHFSPDGRHIVWASSRGIPQGKGNPLISPPELDYWIMGPDGSDKRRLTHFNDPRTAHDVPGSVTMADFDWGPDGRWLIAYRMQGPVPRNRSRSIVLIELDLKSPSN